MENFLETVQQVVTALIMLVGGASILAKFTPTKKDDEFLGKVKNFLLRLSLNQK